MGTPAPNPVAAYKRIFAGVLERRPSGTRQRLASAMGKNRSFVSQIANPAYPTPVPSSHLHLIFELCHFSPHERQHFLAAYEQAHPRRTVAKPETQGTLTVQLPDLGDEARNRKFQALVTDFVNQFAILTRSTNVKGKRP